MSSVSNIDIITGLLIPIVLYIVKKLIDWIGSLLGAPRLKRKYRFDKISVDEKVKVLANIEALKEKPSIPHVLVQIKLRYEQIGIYLPVWHSEQLISFIAAENISSLDVRLRSFLKNTFLGRYSTHGFSLNDKSVKWLYAVNGLFGLFAVVAFVYSGWDITHTFWGRRDAGLFVLFFSIHALAIIAVAAYVINQIEDIFLGAKFGRLFESWISNNRLSVNADTATSAEMILDRQTSS